MLLVYKHFWSSQNLIRILWFLILILGIQFMKKRYLKIMNA